MPKLRLSGRKAALAGVSIAAATAAVVAVAAPASASPTSNRVTTCNDTVRVRSQPSGSAPVVGSCRSGEQVTWDRTQNGYAHLVNKQGWASMDYLNMHRDANSSYRDSNDDSDYNNSDYNDRGRYRNDYNNDNDYNDGYYRRHNDDNGLLGGLGN